MKVGIVCPYSWDVPGGVQFHVRDLAESLIARGHEVSVLAPADDDADDAHDLPPYLVPCGKAVPVRYNGSVARLTFGPVTSARVARWLEQGDFDVLHLHEPVTPSVSVLALWASVEPVVATFHTATLRSRAMHAASPVLRPSLEKILGRIAVSEAARRTVQRHLRGDAVIIPNGVDVPAFAQAPVAPAWVGTPERPTIAFLGRLDEPRKGLAVLLEALPALRARHPGIRLLVAGPGEGAEALAGLDPDDRAAVELLGRISEPDKRSLLASVDLYVAPHTGGESFGIVLVEAMAAGAPVLASDLEAFSDVLEGGACGRLFPVEDAAALATAAADLLADPDARAALRELGRERAQIFDWGVVTDQIVAVYEMAVEGAELGQTNARPRTLIGRWLAARGDT